MLVIITTVTKKIAKLAGHVHTGAMLPAGIDFVANERGERAAGAGERNGMGKRQRNEKDVRK